VRLAADVILEIRATEKVLRPASGARIADAREMSSAYTALRRAIAHCSRDEVQNCLHLTAPRRSSDGKVYVARERGPDGKYCEPELAAMKRLLQRFEKAVRTRVRVAPEEPRWHTHVPRLRALYRKLTGKRATLNHKGSEVTDATRFVAGMLRLCGIRAPMRAVAAYTRRTRKKSPRKTRE
jgi:hypothetical protein